MITFHVSDMTCGHCASAIARAVASVDKDARLAADIPRKLVQVSSTAAPGELVEAIAEAGYHAEAVEAPPQSAPRNSGGCCCASRTAVQPVAAEMGSRSGSCCG
ncbi:MAG TPA: heavy-metal-associated domain-containing protein [Hydrogenophaga sp.]|uniref:heavy-metal-associated domain-containing protein n=1 Tax=Hydrogenophaga sp. TaxID=1904254 RepID=UPI002C1047C4|nr:heavy-metal-associated domain-containing protein [Hydrogenophaga sp.]HSX92458.1 heavy-metal-associated domain-containing protein [Hydrogenophaga sp.]